METFKYMWKSQKGIAIGLFVISVALAGAGIALVSVAQHTGSLEEFATTWKTTPGVITAALLNDNSEPKVTYRYEIDGKSYEGSRVFFSEGPYQSVESLDNGIRLTMEEAEDIPSTLQYSKGSQVVVHYNPHEPRDAVLQPHALRDVRGFLIAGIAAVVAAMFLGARSFMYE